MGLCLLALALAHPQQQQQVLDPLLLQQQVLDPLVRSCSPRMSIGGFN